MRFTIISRSFFYGLDVLLSLSYGSYNDRYPKIASAPVHTGRRISYAKNLEAPHRRLFDPGRSRGGQAGPQRACPASVRDDSRRGRELRAPRPEGSARAAQGRPVGGSQGGPCGLHHEVPQGAPTDALPLERLL